MEYTWNIHEKHMGYTWDILGSTQSYPRSLVLVKVVERLLNYKVKSSKDDIPLVNILNFLPFCIYCVAF